MTDLITDHPFTTAGPGLDDPNPNACHYRATITGRPVVIPPCRYPPEQHAYLTQAAFDAAQREVTEG